jgi:predicted MFS family arabinose efflux permease
MTTMTLDHRTVAGTRPQLLSRRLVLFFVATLGSATSFYLLLSVVPLYATAIGAGGIGAGLATAALTLSGVAGELATPRLAARFGYRLVFASGLVLLGLPALALPVSTGLPAILVVCVVRGIGFGIVVVVGSALVATLVPAQRRGEGLGVYGVVVGVPAVVALPLGVWLAGSAGYAVVFVAGGAAALVGLGVVHALPGRARVDQDQHVGVAAGLRTPALLRPAIVFAATTMAAGIVVTFLPLAVTRASGHLAALALLVHAAAATVSRWFAGRHGDRHGPARLLVPGLVAAAAGIVALVLADSPVAVLAGMALFGTGFGITQNTTMALMFDHVSPADYGTASALWNFAYDAGLGVGAAGFGVLVVHTGYPIAFAVTAALMLTALAPAWRDRY